MPTLSDAIKTFIVQRLACHDSPQEVAEAVKETFGLTISRQQVQIYDPERAGKKPAEKWCDLWRVTRERFFEAVDAEPIAHRVYRLRELAKLYNAAKRRGNHVLAAALLEQAAKESGGIFTNRRELTGKEGGPIETRDASLDDLSNEELAALALELAALGREDAANCAPRAEVARGESHLLPAARLESELPVPDAPIERSRAPGAPAGASGRAHAPRLP